MIIIMFYFLIYFGMGVFLNYLMLYFLDATPLLEAQVTFIMSLVPLLNLFSTNIFAYISDRFNKHRFVLSISMLCSVVMSIALYLVSKTGIIPLIIFAYYILSFFMQAPMQLIENFAFEYSKIARQSYGKIRSFGSLGYAIAGYFGGYLTHQFGLPIIFIVFSLA